ncbi:MAG: acetyl-CoA carboxylase biotin carboxyl carrier protein [Planctomycetaceae bacterium]
MSAEHTGTNESFDLDKLRELIALMETHKLSEIDLRKGGERWRVRRGPEEVVQMFPAAGLVSAFPPPFPAAPRPEPSTAEANEGLVIESPTVGTFFEAPSPGDPPFVSVGSRVSEDTVVCIIEAMKVFNQIPAEVNGTIIAILVKNGDAVEFGQPLFRVRLG